MMKFKKGSILILTLWILSFLVIFAIGLGNNISGELYLASHLQDRLKMYYFAKAGIERALVTLDDDETPLCDSLDELWGNNEEFFKKRPLDTGYITVSYEVERENEGEEEQSETVTLYGLMDESSKININTAPKDVLRALLENIGEVDYEEAADIANAIVDWRDADIFISPGGAENNYYDNLKLPYPCKNGNFEVLEELLLVKGMTPEIYQKIVKLITIYTKGKVNVNTADSLVFYALGLNSCLAKRIVQLRKGGDGIDGTEDDNIFKSVAEIRNIGHLFTEEAEEINRLVSLGIFDVKTDTFRIISSGILEKGEQNLQRSIICVVRREKGKKSRILYWHED